MVNKAWESQQKRLNKIAEIQKLVDYLEQQEYRLTRYCRRCNTWGVLCPAVD